jgi:MFS family permease
MGLGVVSIIPNKLISAIQLLFILCPNRRLRGSFPLLPTPCVSHLKPTAECSLVALACTVIEASLIDLIGRRNLFLGGAIGCWTMCLIVGCMSLPVNKSSAINSLTLFFSLMWRVGSTLLGNLGWSYVAETGSSRLRAKTAGIAAAGGVCLGLVFNTSLPYMLNPIGA